MSGQARLDHLIEIAYSNERASITEEHYWKLGFPGSDVSRALRHAAATHGTFQWPDDIPPEEHAAWHCDNCGMLYPASEDEGGDEEYEEEYGEDGTALFLFRTQDAAGRGLTFAQEIGDGGELIGLYGPYIDSEDPVQSAFGGEYTLALDDEAWIATTPEWDRAGG